MLEEMASIDWK